MTRICLHFLKGCLFTIHQVDCVTFQTFFGFTDIWLKMLTFKDNAILNFFWISVNRIKQLHFFAIDFFQGSYDTSSLLFSYGTHELTNAKLCPGNFLSKEKLPKVYEP